jgi:beta-glucosidase
MYIRKNADQRAELLLAHSTVGQKLRWLDERAANSPTQTTFSGVTYPVHVACTPTVVYADGRRPGRARAGRNGDDLITAVAAANPNTVVAPETGTATTMPWLAGVKRVVEAWYPGDRQGTALARLLYGDTDFTGRLPMAFPRSLADTPTDTPARYRGTFADGSTTRPAGSTAIRQVSYSEGLKVGYKCYDSQGIEPLFPFGFGLSYLSHLSDPAGHSASARRTGNGDGQFDVRNTGTRAGTATRSCTSRCRRSPASPGSGLSDTARRS